MTDFKAGQKVVVDGTTIATIVTYDPSINIVTYETKQGGSTNRTTNALSHTKLAPLTEVLEAALAEEAGLEEEYRARSSSHVTEETVTNAENVHPDFDSLQ